ncbi:hypothetical protein BDF21DRAFT_422715 [Thamnidium elegans]|nr:hypothetical protein BDF21DRAFT_422715 [Thamnidium elegans]
MKNIVIVGGGFAGTQVAKALEKQLVKLKDEECRIILVEKKTHFYHSIAGLRCAVVDWDKKVMIPYTNLFQEKKNTVVQASAMQLEKHQVVLDKAVPEFGTTIPYDYLVITTGTRYPAPAKATALDYDTTHADLSNIRQQVKAAKSIVIVGGGPVGLELAGEIHDVYPSTKITIVHTEPEILSDVPKVRTRMLDLLKKNGIELVTNDSVMIPSSVQETLYHPQNNVVETEGGKCFQDVDLVMLAFGNRPETDWLKSAGVLAENGYVKVKDTYQVDHADFSHVLVMGDAADFKETKLAYRITGHVPTVVQNIVQMAVKNQSPTGKYKKAPDAMVITFGQSQGVGLLPFFGITVGSWPVSLVKSKNLFLGQSWDTLNQKEPSL